jgi:molybdopterin-guanine dinucleotide biosynthesis protein
MDAGKTQTAAFLTRGLRAAGHRVGYLKLTGTGAGGDTWLLADAGADRVLDFTDAGMASTYRATLERIEAAMDDLLADMAEHAIDTVVMEVADGVFQQETAALIRGQHFQSRVDGIVLAGRDAMGVVAGLAVLEHTGVPVLTLSGLLCASPLQRREAESATGLATLNREELARADTAMRLLTTAREAHITLTHNTQEAC